ncbi:unnamed protein product [Acidithrix sp. C25]|nr:unnamed protein product [Acidithrix sp. C25]
MLRRHRRERITSSLAREIALDCWIFGPIFLAHQTGQLRCGGFGVG